MLERVVSVLSVTIDASVVAPPSVGCSSDEIHDYVEQLIYWSRLRSVPWMSTYMSERAMLALIEDGVYPYPPNLRQLFIEKGIVEYDVNTLSSIATSLLQFTSSFETQFLLKDILAEDVKTDPDLISADLTPSLAAELERRTLLVSVLQCLCTQPVKDHFLVMRPTLNAPVINLAAHIYYIDHQRDDVMECPTPPEFYHGSVIACTDLAGILDYLDLRSVWKTISNESSMMYLLTAMAQHMGVISEVRMMNEKLEKFSLGCEFLETASDCCNANSESFSRKLLRAMVETLLEMKLDNSHRLRDSISGGSTAVRRGSDVAWRRDIDLQYHLHYWVRADGSIEFASVVVHDDFSIPRCL